jgi:hypothetical protein
MWKLPERGSHGEGNLKMWLTHRYFEQVKQAERLDQKVTVHRLIICRRDEQRDEICTHFIISPETYPVESIRLQERKTNHWNGITLKLALVAGRYNEQGTTRMHLRAGLPKKLKPEGKPLDTLT